MLRYIRGRDIKMSKMISKSINTTLNSSTYTEIIAGETDCYGFGFFVQDSGSLVEFYIAWDSSGDNATLMPAMGYAYGDFQQKGTTVCWAKAVSGTPSFVILPGKYSSYK